MKEGMNMDKLLEILEDINPNIDYKSEKKLIDDGLLDSLAIVALVSELEDAFDIEITPVDLVPENFNSVEALFNMINRLQEEN